MPTYSSSHFLNIIPLKNMHKISTWFWNVVIWYISTSTIFFGGLFSSRVLKRHISGFEILIIMLGGDSIYYWRQTRQTDLWFMIHDGVIKWKHFPVTGPLRGEFTGHRRIPLTKASDAELWSFLWSTPQ